MNRDEYEGFLRAMYDARLTNQPDSVDDFMHEDLVYVIEGLGVEDPNSIATRISGKAAFREMMDTLTASWKWRAIALHDAIIDGDRAVVRYTLTMEFGPLQHRFDTEVVNFVTLKDGLIVSLTEFVDTATATSLIEKATEAAG